MAGDAPLRRVRALSARTHFASGFGQVHFDPDSENPDIAKPLMPETEIAKLVEWGWVADDVQEDAVPMKRGGRPRQKAAAQQDPDAGNGASNEQPAAPAGNDEAPTE